MGILGGSAKLIAYAADDRHSAITLFHKRGDAHAPVRDHACQCPVSISTFTQFPTFTSAMLAFFDRWRIERELQRERELSAQISAKP